MSKVIHKYTVHRGDTQGIGMPVGASILSCGVKPGENGLQMWALVDPKAEKENRYFCILGTGWSLQDSSQMEFIGTAVDGEFVWHLFEVK